MLNQTMFIKTYEDIIIKKKLTAIRLNFKSVIISANIENLKFCSCKLDTEEIFKN